MPADISPTVLLGAFPPSGHVPVGWAEALRAGCLRGRMHVLAAVALVGKLLTQSASYRQ